MLNKAQRASIVAIVILALSGAAPAGAQGAELQAAAADEYQKYAAKVESELAAKAQSGSILWLSARSTRAGPGRRGGGGALDGRRRYHRHGRSDP